LGLVLAGCGGAAGPVTNTPPPTISVSISASSTALGTGQSSSLTATVSNDTSNAGVTWSLSQDAQGTLTTVDAFHATYAAGTVTQAGSVVVTATSKADSTKTATQTIQLALVLTVNLTPATSDIGPNQTVNLLASVANDGTTPGVTWSLNNGAAGTLTTVDATHATYQSPSSVSAGGTVTVTGTSRSDNTKTGTATINLHPVSVTMSAPATSAVAPLQTSMVSATVGFDPKGVTWSASTGTVAALDACPNGTCTAAYMGPEDINASGTTATITATSVSDPSKKDSKTINLTMQANWEELAAFDNGLHMGAVKPYADLARGNNTYQPDRMIFHEISLGPNGQPLNTEVWRLTNDSPVANPTSSDDVPGWFTAGTLNRTPWNETGTFFTLSGNPCLRDGKSGDAQVFCTAALLPKGEGADLHNDLFDAAGDLFQMIVPTDIGGNAQQGLSSGYFPWDKDTTNPASANLFYFVTSGETAGALGAGQPSSALYSVDISNNFQIKEIVALPERTDPANATCGTGGNQPCTINKEIPSYLSEDDLVMVKEVNPPASETSANAYIPLIFMVDVNPAHATFGQIVHQFPINNAAVPQLPCTLNNLAQPLPVVPCLNNNTSINDPAHDDYHIHDIYFQRDAADHFLLNYGPKGSVGEFAFWQMSVDGTVASIAYPNAIPLAGTPYMSHPAMNFDGTKVSFSGYDTSDDMLGGTAAGVGTWVRSVDQITTGFSNGSVIGNLGNQSPNHQGWDGYDPGYVIFDGFLVDLPAGYLAQGYPATFLPSGCDPNNGNPDCIAPYGLMSDSPTDANGTGVRVLVNYGQRDESEVTLNKAPGMTDGPAQSPDATKAMFIKPDDMANVNASFNAYIAVDHRPLPPVLNSVSGSSPSITLNWTPYLTHREVAGYHVYRSTDNGKTWTEVVNASNTAAFGSVPATTFTDTSAPAGTVWYGVTAQEYSGLESSILSNLVTQSNAAAGAQGTTGFDTTAPTSATGLTVTKMSNPGEWKLTWTKSPSADVRYYNIYYDGGNVVPNLSSFAEAQHYLIDSPAATETSYIYWEANPNDVPVFGIVAVDRQDNFSALACVFTSNPAAPCQ